MSTKRSRVFKRTGKFIAILFLATMPRTVAFGAVGEVWLAHNAGRHPVNHRFNSEVHQFGELNHADHPYAGLMHEKHAVGAEHEKWHEHEATAQTSGDHLIAGNFWIGTNTHYSDSAYGNWAPLHGIEWYHRSRS